VESLVLKDMGNDDYNVIVGQIVIELSRSSYAPDFKPVWRWWAVRIRGMILATAASGHTIRDKNLIKFLEAHLNELSS
jgi:hypothetical protein